MKQQKGFTLVELLVVIAIVGLLAAYAIPSYRQSVLKAGRSEGQAALLKLASIQERFYANNNRYGRTADIEVGRIFPGFETENGKYRVLNILLAAGGYNLIVTAIGSQADDTLCPTITLNYLGRKGPNAECWK